MLLILGTLRLPPENVSAAREAMRRMIEASRAEQGCVEYGYAEDVLVPGLIHVKEMWLTQADIERHFRSKHIVEWRSCWPTLGITDRDLKRYQSGEGIPT